jgi:hypothetical protein
VKLADDLSSEAFHVTAYLFAVGNAEKIRVEISGPRVGGRKTWKRTRSFEAERDAITYVADERSAFARGSGCQKSPR